LNALAGFRCFLERLQPDFMRSQLAQQLMCKTANDGRWRTIQEQAELMVGARSGCVPLFAAHEDFNQRGRAGGFVSRRHIIAAVVAAKNAEGTRLDAAPSRNFTSPTFDLCKFAGRHGAMPQPGSR
jgi:hypothetical protein